MIGGSVPDYDLDPPWISKDENWEEKELRRIEDDIDRDQERRWENEDSNARKN